MPCYTEPHSYCNHGINKIDEAICDFESAMQKVKCEFAELVKNYNQELDERVKYYKDKSDEATRLLCEVMDEIALQSPETFLSEEAKTWFLKHKEWDKKRKEGE